MKKKVATGRDLTDINKTVLAKLEARTILFKDYGSGSLATIAVLDAARRYAATNERFDQELKALFATFAVDIRDSRKFAKLGSRDRLNKIGKNPSQLRHLVSTVLHDVIGWRTHSPTDDQPVLRKFVTKQNK